MSDRRWLIIHWGCLIVVIVLILLTTAKIIIYTNFGPNPDVISLEMIDEAALEVILYFLLLPCFTIIFWLRRRTWVFFPWQHSNAKK